MSTPSEKPKTVAVLINASSGGQVTGVLDAISVRLRQTGYSIGKAIETRGNPVPSLKAIRKQNPDAAVVFGGDGTQAAALAYLTCPVLPLPGGTLNWLSRAVLGEGNWQDILEACLRNPIISDLHAGQIVERAGASGAQATPGDADVHPFFLVAQFGGPTLFAKSREAIRSGIYKRAWIAARKAWARSFAYQLQSKELAEPTSGSAYSTIVANTALASDVHSDSEALEVAGFDIDNPLSGAALGLHAILDDWRHSPQVKLTSRQVFHIQCDRKVPALLDGEPRWFHPPLRVETCHSIARLWSAAS